MLTTESISCQEVLLGRPEGGATLVRVETGDGDAVDAEHERLQGRINVADIGSGRKDARLKRDAVGDFEERINILKINLPQFEDMDGVWVEGGQVDDCIRRAEEKVVSMLKAALQCILDVEFANIIAGTVADVVAISNLKGSCMSSVGTSTICDVTTLPFGSWHAKSSCKGSDPSPL